MNKAQREEEKNRRKALKYEYKRKMEYQEWKQELDHLFDLMHEDTDIDVDFEYVEHRVQCLQADITGYEIAQAAIESGNEEMPVNPYEEGLG